MRRTFIRYSKWEYWPMWLAYLPSSIYYLYLSMKASTPFFFSAANPSIANGGMFFESKKEVYALMPEHVYPSTLHFEAGVDVGAIEIAMQKVGMEFPVVAKPDRGERGWLVKIINDLSTLMKYVEHVQRPFLIQSYVTFPLEVSVFYVKHPQEATGTITSITGKKLLSVIGDGYSSVRQLVCRNDRAFLQLKIIEKQRLVDLQRIPEKGEEVILVHIGNHARGTTFLDWNHFITPQLIAQIDQISRQIPDFYFGRYDIMCASMEALSAGKSFYILELNGAGAEPAHIYQPGYSYFKAQRVIMKHFKYMYEIAQYHHRNGVPYMTWKTYREQKKKEQQFKEGLNNECI